MGRGETVRCGEAVRWRGPPLKETEERPRVAERRKGMLSDAEPF